MKTTLFLGLKQRANTALAISIFCLLAQGAHAQSTPMMAVQNFDGGSNEWLYTATGTSQIVSGVSAGNDRPTGVNLFTSSPNGLAITSATETLVFQPLSFTTAVGNYLQFRLAAFSTNPANGLDTGDFIRVEISPDQGGVYYNTLEVRGFNDAHWGFASGTGIASATYDANNTPTTFAPGSGGSRTTDGYSTVRIDLSNVSLTNVTVRITATNGNNERWVIDDVTLGSSAPLPVELKSFTAEPTAKGTQLQWVTASEKNNAGFEVQRSATSRYFETIGRVAGQGSSTQAHRYEWLDARPLNGLSYYRLRQLDTDGTETFSPVVAVRSSDVTKVAFFPNPTTDRLTLGPMEGKVRYRVLNMLGQAVLAGETAGGSTIDVQALRSGSYFLELQTPEGSQTQRFVREL